MDILLWDISLWDILLWNKTYGKPSYVVVKSNWSEGWQ